MKKLEDLSKRELLHFIQNYTGDVNIYDTLAECVVCGDSPDTSDTIYYYQCDECYNADVREGDKVKNRATTEEEKEEVLKKLLQVWIENPELRLGQLLLNLRKDFYYTEDFTLISLIEDFYEKEENEKK